MIRFTLIALLAAGLFSSCATCWSGGIPLRPSEEAALQGAVRDFGDTSKAVVYRGLAHPEADTARYEKQVKAGGWVEFEDFKFFKEPVDVPRRTIDQVLSLYAQPGSHQAWGPKELCPGFHPDYAIVWSDRGTRRVLQLCYGCHEWKFFGPGGMLLTDISEEAYFGPLTTEWLEKEGR
ncbi:hypothetical protein [Haloferula sp. A504]|uniref:hypothetical protein n=1 Tax=Haloferula sp. A504 TaxID=3373601 RepID=UPI0031C22174|nr:hypothetical protein [Verrucomicrobiaceae bacterium E54]